MFVYYFLVRFNSTTFDYRQNLQILGRGDEVAVVQGPEAEYGTCG